MPSNSEVAQRYIKSIEQGKTGEDLAEFFDPAIEYTEFPNKIFPKGRTAGAAEMKAASEKGKKLLSGQVYEIKNVIEHGDQVAMELHWTGTLAVQVQSLQPGDQMRDHFSVFLVFRNGKIVSQHNYDCYEPW